MCRWVASGEADADGGTIRGDEGPECKNVVRKYFVFLEFLDEFANMPLPLGTRLF